MCQRVVQKCPVPVQWPEIPEGGASEVAAAGFVEDEKGLKGFG